VPSGEPEPGEPATPTWQPNHNNQYNRPPDLHIQRQVSGFRLSSPARSASRSYPDSGLSNAPLAWIGRYRRTVRDYELLPEHHAAFVRWPMTIIMDRRLTRRP
jgi:hypothetical protein